jgi:hypothetical protein
MITWPEIEPAYEGPASIKDIRTAQPGRRDIVSPLGTSVKRTACGSRCPGDLAAQREPVALAVAEACHPEVGRGQSRDEMPFPFERLPGMRGDDLSVARRLGAGPAHRRHESPETA